jgi:hypothetical protein
MNFALKVTRYHPESELNNSSTEHWREPLCAQLEASAAGQPAVGNRPFAARITRTRPKCAHSEIMHAVRASLIQSQMECDRASSRASIRFIHMADANLAAAAAQQTHVRSLVWQTLSGR